MDELMFNILLGILVITSILHLIALQKSDKRLERNADYLERYITLLEKQDDIDGVDDR